MTATTTESLLEAAAHDGSMDIAEWPRVLEAVLQRLHDIVYSEFTLPTPVVSLPPPARPLDPSTIPASPIPEPSPSRVPATQSEDNSETAEPLSQTSSNANKENTAPPTSIPATAPPSSETPVPSSSNSEDLLANYPVLADSYNASINALKNSFAESPPYTIQRLAELVLYPKTYYRFLPPYLAALDRTVSVSSSTTSFPLIHHQNTPNGVYMQNGEDENSSGPSGDEGLGGALLTPIPWLRKTNGNEETAARQQDGELHTEGTETIEGPNGAGRIETVSVTVNGIPSVTQTATATSPEGNGMSTEQELRGQGAVTQGELLRQEQEAGVVPVAQTTARRNVMGHGGAVPRDTAAELEDEDEVPHARGPEEIGMEDLGPQAGSLGASTPLDLEAALGKKERSPQPSEDVNAEKKKDEVPVEAAQVAEEATREAAADAEAVGATSSEVKDQDGDYVLVDRDDEGEVS